jgi:hypothetical protein
VSRPGRPPAPARPDFPAERGVTKFCTLTERTLREMKSLKTIGIAWKQDLPATEFWKRYDREEFKE